VFDSLKEARQFLPLGQGDYELESQVGCPAIFITSAQISKPLPSLGLTAAKRLPVSQRTGAVLTGQFTIAAPKEMK